MILSRMPPRRLPTPPSTGVTFDRAATVFRDQLALTVFDQAHSESEERWFTLGLDAGGKLLAVAHTYQHTSEALIAHVAQQHRAGFAPA